MINRPIDSPLLCSSFLEIPPDETFVTALLSFSKLRISIISLSSCSFVSLVSVSVTRL